MEIKLNNEEVAEIVERIEDELGNVYKDKTKVFKEGDDYRKGLSIEDEPDLYNEVERIISRDYIKLCEETIDAICDELCIGALEDSFRERLMDNYND